MINEAQARPNHSIQDQTLDAGEESETHVQIKMLTILSFEDLLIKL